MNTLPRLNKAFSVLIGIGLGMLIIVATQLTMWGMDREPPFYLVEATSTPVKPGSNTTIKAIVKRDLSRKCNVVYSRVFYDSVGTRFDLTDTPQKTNAKGLDDLDRRTPNELKIGVEIPEAAQRGTGAVVTFLDYDCNPVHRFYPISVVMSVNVEVL